MTNQQWLHWDLLDMKITIEGATKGKRAIADEPRAALLERLKKVDQFIAKLDGPLRMVTRIPENQEYIEKETDSIIDDARELMHYKPNPKKWRVNIRYGNDDRAIEALRAQGYTNEAIGFVI